jgi:hypothetical protein
MQREVEKYADFFNVPLGVAMQNRQVVRGVGGPIWRRKYGRGVVYVNSNDHNTVTVMLGGKMRRLNGTPVDSITFPPHTGAVLLFMPTR